MHRLARSLVADHRRVGRRDRSPPPPPRTPRTGGAGHRLASARCGGRPATHGPWRRRRWRQARPGARSPAGPRAGTPRCVPGGRRPQRRGGVDPGRRGCPARSARRCPGPFPGRPYGSSVARVHRRRDVCSAWSPGGDRASGRASRSACSSTSLQPPGQPPGSCWPSGRTLPSACVRPWVVEARGGSPSRRAGAGSPGHDGRPGAGRWPGDPRSSVRGSAHRGRSGRAGEAVPPAARRTVPDTATTAAHPQREQPDHSWATVQAIGPGVGSARYAAVYRSSVTAPGSTTARPISPAARSARQRGIPALGRAPCGLWPTVAPGGARAPRR